MFGSDPHLHDPRARARNHDPGRPDDQSGRGHQSYRAKRIVEHCNLFVAIVGPRLGGREGVADTEALTIVHEVVPSFLAHHSIVGLGSGEALGQVRLRGSTRSQVAARSRQTKDAPRACPRRRDTPRGVPGVWLVRTRVLDGQIRTSRLGRARRRRVLVGHPTQHPIATANATLARQTKSPGRHPAEARRGRRLRALRSSS